jgi:hypothetical protein
MNRAQMHRRPLNVARDFAPAWHAVPLALLIVLAGALLLAGGG